MFGWLRQLFKGDPERPQEKVIEGNLWEEPDDEVITEEDSPVRHALIKAALESKTGAVTGKRNPDGTWTVKEI